MFQGVRSVVSVNALVFAAIGVGLVNNVLIAAVFGLTKRVDAFFAAMTLPSLFMILCVDYLGKNFLPVYAIARQESEESAARMTSTIVTVMLLLATAVAGLMAIFSRQLFDFLLPGFEADETGLVTHYFLIMAPAIVLMAVSAFHEHVCQYNEQFTRIVGIRMALPVTNLVAIVTLGPVIDEYCLPVGYLAGHTVVFVLMAISARYRFAPRLIIRRHLERKVFVNSAILMSTGFVARARSIVMNALASTLGGGAISALALTTKLTEPLERVAFTGARMFMFSRSARLFAERRQHDLGRLYSAGLRVIFLLLTPVLWWIGLNSAPIVEVFFARGEFTPQMTAVVAGTLMGMIPSVLFTGVTQLLANGFYAADRVGTPAVVMPLGMLVYVAAAVPLTDILGVQGLAIATTLTTISVFTAMYVRLPSVVERFEAGRTAGQLMAYALLSGVVAVFTQAALQGLDLPPTVVAIASLPIGVALYFGILSAARDNTCTGLRRFARDWFHARAPA